MPIQRLRIYPCQAKKELALIVWIMAWTAECLACDDSFTHVRITYTNHHRRAGLEFSVRRHKPASLSHIHIGVHKPSQCAASHAKHNHNKQIDEGWFHDLNICIGSVYLIYDMIDIIGRLKPTLGLNTDISKSSRTSHGLHHGYWRARECYVGSTHAGEVPLRTGRQTG